MSEVGSLWVRLRGDTKDFESAMKGMSKKMEAAGQRMQEIGGGLTQGVTLPIVALGAGAIAAATQVEGAMATIRAGTGATGKDLEGLGEDFRAVFGKVPENAQQVSAAIAGLNTRLGLTGEPLQQLTEQMLELADLTGTQIEPLVASATRVFGDWSVATGEQAGTLDLLYKVSQATGLGVDRLSDSLVQFGAPLRQMGFSLAESATLMGKWEKEGVNAELVLGSFRVAMGNFARENIPMREGLDQTMKRIQELGPSAEATALAMDVFGARAGPDMAAAILEGRFELDALMAQIEASPDTIVKAGAETETFAEKLAMMRNQATLAFEPIGMRLMDALVQIQPQLMAVIGAVAGLAERFAALSPTTQTTILAVVGLVAALGPLLLIAGHVMTAVAALIGIVAKFKTALAAAKVIIGGASVALPILKAAFLLLTGPIGLVIAAVAALGVAGVALVRNWDTVRAFFVGIPGTISRALSGLANIITRPFQAAWDRVNGITASIQSALSRLNPFARFSPSLVDNVRAGVKVIQSEYAKLERLQIPAVGAVMPQGATSPAMTMAAAGPTAYHGPLFTVQNMTVRSDADIEAISRQLHRNIQAGVKARGGR